MKAGIGLAKVVLSLPAPLLISNMQLTGINVILLSHAIHRVSEQFSQRNSRKSH